jgi:type VI secretion system protein ImpF
MHAFRAAFSSRDARKTVDERDTSGERVIASRRSSPRNLVSHKDLKEELSDDLAALLNTVKMSSCEDLSPFSHVAKSILNYGLSDLTAISIDEIMVNDIGDGLKAVLVEYEPRLIANTIQVERDETVDDGLLKIRFNVHAEMFATPVDVPVEFVADLELDSGNMRISRL